MNSKLLMVFCGLGIFMSFLTPVIAQHEGDVWVGADGGGKVTIGGFDPAVNYVSLPATSGILKGWADNDPGFDHLIEHDDDSGANPLEPGAEIWLEVVAFDPAFRLIDNAFKIIDSPGEMTLLGDDHLHTHLTWHINSLDPAFDPEQCVWEATAQLLDLGSTGFEPSDPFTFYFTNVETREADGDFDQDGAVDLTDFHAFDECMSLPGTRTSPSDPEVTTCEVDCANAFDFDRDLDVDWLDFGEFQNLFGG